MEKFQRSNNVHQILGNKAEQRGAHIIADYHRDVIHLQNSRKTILSRKEREVVFQEADRSVRMSRSRRGHSDYFG